MGAKVAAKSVLTSVCTAIAGHLTAAGATISGGALAWFVVLPAVLVFAGIQINTFPADLAAKVAPKIRDELDGAKFREQNRSALHQIFTEAMKDGSWALAKKVVAEIPEVKGVEDAAKQYLKEAEERAVDAVRH